MTRAHDRNVQVLIAGGGPVGLGLAIELGQRGIPCLLIERRREPQHIPKGQNLTQRTLEHFFFWGAERALRAARTIPPEFGIGGLTAYGTLLSGYHYDWLQRELVAPFYFCANERLPQYATEAVLRQRLSQLATVETLYGWKVDALTGDEDGVEVRARSEAGESLVAHARYAVGCDGSHSFVREQAGIASVRTEHDRRMVLLVFRSKGLHDLLTRFPRKSYFNVLNPALDGYWQFFGRVDLGSNWFFHAPVAPECDERFDFRTYLHDAVGAAFDVELEHIGFWDLRIAIAERYRKGAVFLAGDAAHSHPPYGGYGVNTGFEDARNLGWKLAAVLQGWGGAQLLDSYGEERRPVFESTARDFIERAIANDRDFLGAYDPQRDRSAFERAWAERASGAASEVASFEPNYEGSSICGSASGKRPSAVGAHVFAARAGHHLAPFELSSGRNVYEELTGGFALLCFGEQAAAARQFERAAAAMQLPLTIIRGDAAGATFYGAPLVLVRPDQFVAWSGDAATGAEGVLMRGIGGATPRGLR